MKAMKAIKGYEGLYSISEDGEIRSEDRVVSHKGYGKMKRKGALKKIFSNADGYHTVTLSKNNKAKTYTVHRLVALAYVANSENASEINHKDGDKTNNRASNLEWCSRSENNQHAYDIGLNTPKKGSLNGNSKLKEKEVLWIKRLKDKLSKEILSEMFGVSTRAIENIHYEQSWRHLWI